MTPDSVPSDISDEAVREEAIAWLVRLQSGDSKDHPAFEAWYAQDPRHAEIYDDVLANWDKMAAAAHTPAARARRSGGTRGPWIIAFSALAAAVAAAVLLLPAGIWQQPGLSDAEGRERVQFASAAGETRTVRLPDGSQAILDVSSRLSLDFSSTERSMRLDRGRARFTVAHGDDRPFVVWAGQAKVIAHGTIFDVGFVGEKVLVSLLEGVVEVQGASGAAVSGARASRILEPGQKLIVAGSSPAATPEPVRPADVRWTPNAMLSFEDVPLEEVIAAVNRFNDLSVALADPALGKLRFSGTFDARDPDAFAQMTASMFDLVLTREDGGIHLSSALKK